MMTKALALAALTLAAGNVFAADQITTTIVINKNCSGSPILGPASLTFTSTNQGDALPTGYLPVNYAVTCGQDTAYKLTFSPLGSGRLLIKAGNPSYTIGYELRRGTDTTCAGTKVGAADNTANADGDLIYKVGTGTSQDNYVCAVLVSGQNSNLKAAGTYSDVVPVTFTY